MAGANPHAATVKVTIPGIDPLVEGHFDDAGAAIDATSPSRRHGAKRVSGSRDGSCELDLKAGAIVVELDSMVAPTGLKGVESTNAPLRRRAQMP